MYVRHDTAWIVGHTEVMRLGIAAKSRGVDFSEIGYRLKVSVADEGPCTRKRERRT
jgi:hypothetical protein